MALQHQVCKSTCCAHRCTIESLNRRSAGQRRLAEWRSGCSLRQAVADLQQLKVWVRTVQPETGDRTEADLLSLCQADAPRPGRTPAWPIACACLFPRPLDLWARLTRYRTWRGPQDRRSTAPTTAANAPSAGGSRSATARCAATSVSSRPSMSAVSWPGVATTWARRSELATLMRISAARTKAVHPDPGTFAYRLPISGRSRH